MRSNKFYLMVAGLAVISMGAAYSTVRMIEIGPTATITSTFPILDFIDDTTGDSSFEVIARGDNLAIGERFGTPSVRIFDDAENNALQVSGRGVGVGNPVGGVEPAAGLTVGSGAIFFDSDDPAASRWFALGGGGFLLANEDSPAFPFAIADEAQTASLVVDFNSSVLIAGTDPLTSNAVGGVADAKLHVLTDDGSPGPGGLKVEDARSTVANRALMELVNNGGVRMALDNLNVNERWEFFNNSAGDFNITRNGSGGTEFAVTRAGGMTVGPGAATNLSLRPSGNLFITGTLFETSDREKKENFEEVDCEKVLEQIAEMPISTWNYKADEVEIRHMGPVAQDFRSAFELGDSDKTIATTDKVGVSLAAIKALNTKVQNKDEEIEALGSKLDEKDEQIESLKNELQEIDSRMSRLEQLLKDTVSAGAK